MTRDSPGFGSSGRNRRGIGHHLPARGDRQRQREPCLEIGLIEAGERQLRACGHEERVEKLVVAVERSVAGGEVDGDLVPARRCRAGGNDEMPIFKDGVQLASPHHQRAHVVARLCKVEDDAVRLVQPEARNHTSLHRLATIGRDIEGKLVSQIVDGRAPLACQFLRNAAAWRCRRGRRLRRRDGQRGSAQRQR